MGRWLVLVGCSCHLNWNYSSLPGNRCYACVFQGPTDQEAFVSCYDKKLLCCYNHNRVLFRLCSSFFSDNLAFHSRPTIQRSCSSHTDTISRAIGFLCLIESTILCKLFFLTKCSDEKLPALIISK